MSSNGPDDYKPSRLEIPARDGETIVSLDPAERFGIVTLEGPGDSKHVQLNIGSRMTVQTYAAQSTTASTSVEFVLQSQVPEENPFADITSSEVVDFGTSTDNVVHLFTEPWVVSDTVRLVASPTQDTTGYPFDVALHIEAAGV